MNGFQFVIRRAAPLATTYTLGNVDLQEVGIGESRLLADELMADGRWYVLAVGLQLGCYNAVVRRIHNHFEVRDYAVALRQVDEDDQEQGAVA